MVVKESRLVVIDSTVIDSTVNESSKGDIAYLEPIVKLPVSTVNTGVLIIVLAVWFVGSAIFNDTTPRLMNALQKNGGENIDVSMIEFVISIIIGCISLAFQGQRPFPSAQLIKTSLFIGLLHSASCRLFIFGLQYIPVSLAQTIRASNPLITLIFSTAIFGLPLPKVSSLLSLIPLLAGFGLAIVADMTVEPIGIFASVGSVCCLVLVNGFSKRVLEDKKINHIRPTELELQCWTLQGAFLLLCPQWFYTAGHERLRNIVNAQNAEIESSKVLVLCLWNGILFFTEQIAQFFAISMLSPLSLAVTDTTRRLFIVIVSGFVLQGNTPNFSNVVGALLVYIGAALYALSISQTTQKQKLICTEDSIGDSF